MNKSQLFFLAYIYIYIQEKKYISIGLNCLSAAILKVYDLRIDSSMFDWSISTLEILINYLENDLDYGIKNVSLLKFSHHNDMNYKIRTIKRFFDIFKSKEIIFLLSTQINFDIIIINKLISVIKKT